MGLFGYHDIRTPQEREAHAKWKLAEKERICFTKDFDSLTEYEKRNYRSDWTREESEMFYQLQLMLEERADYACYIRCFWNNKCYEIKAKAADVQWRLGDSRSLISTNDGIYDKNFERGLDEAYNLAGKALKENYISADSDEGKRLVARYTRINSDMMTQILDCHKNVVFDREEFDAKLEKEQMEIEQAENQITDMIIVAEQSEIMIIESGRLLYDICQFPDPVMRGSINQVPEEIREKIAQDIADGNPKVTAVPGKQYKYDRLVHDALWTKDRLEGHVVGRDFDGKEKTFYYTFSTTAQLARCTMAIPEPHAYQDIPFTQIPRKLKIQAVHDSFEAATGSYLDLNKMLTGQEIDGFLRKEGITAVSYKGLAPEEKQKEIPEDIKEENPDEALEETPKKMPEQPEKARKKRWFGR